MVRSFRGSFPERSSALSFSSNQISVQLLILSNGFPSYVFGGHLTTLALSFNFHSFMLFKFNPNLFPQLWSVGIRVNADGL